MWLELTIHPDNGAGAGEAKAFWFGQGGITILGPYDGGRGSAVWQEGWESPALVREPYEAVKQALGIQRVQTPPVVLPFGGKEPPKNILLENPITYPPG